MKKLIIFSTLIFLISLPAFAIKAIMSKRELCNNILQAQKNIQGHQFVTNRDLSSYISILDTLGDNGFSRQLEKLNNQSHVIDAGAGSGVFSKQIAGISSFLNLPDRSRFSTPIPVLLKYKDQNWLPENRPRITAIGVNSTDIENLPLDQQSANIRFLSGYIEDISNEDILHFGKADIITDVYGAIAYSLHPDIVIRKYIELLKDNGTAYLHMNYRPHNPLEDDRVKTLSGDHFQLAEWISQIQGIKAEIVFPCILKIQRNNQPLVVPKLELIYLDTAFVPPTRKFVEVQ